MCDKTTFERIRFAGDGLSRREFTQWSLGAGAALSAQIEVYEGALHSWTTPDSPVHHPQQAERAWRGMLNLFTAALA